MLKLRETAIFSLAILTFKLSASLARPDHCKFQANGKLGRIESDVCNSYDDFKPTSIATTRSYVSVSNLQGKWSPFASNKLLFNVTFDARGEGELELRLTSSHRPLLLCCGIIRKPQENVLDEDSYERIHVEILCSQQMMKFGNNLQLLVDQVTTNNRRDLPSRLAVDLPGCTVPAFKNSALCKVEGEAKKKKIRFQVRRLHNRPALRVILSRDVYKSRLKATRRVVVEVREQSPPDVWLKYGRLLRRRELRWPKRNARFYNLQLKRTYVIAVYEVGETNIFTKTISLC